MTVTFGHIWTNLWEMLPDEWANHPGVWWKILDTIPLDPTCKNQMLHIIQRWSKNYKQWSTGSLPSLKKKIGKMADTISQTSLPARHLDELKEWLSDWLNEQQLSEEELSSSLSMSLTTALPTYIPSTVARTQTDRAGATSKRSQKRKRTLDDFFESLHPSKRSNEAIGKISQNIFVRKGDEQRSLKSTVPYKDFLLKLQIYPTLSYQAKMKEDHTQAWRTATTRLTITMNENEELNRKVMEVLEVAKDEVLATQEEMEVSEETLE
nr:MAG: non-structural protein [Canine parvovirus]